jgi:hypothetical protein
MITAAQLLPLLDSMAAGVSVFEAALGSTGAEAGTVAAGAEANIVALTGINDRTVQDDLLPAFVARLGRLIAPHLSMVISAREVQRALDVHTGGLTTFLKANAAQVHPNLTKIGLLLDPDVLFSPAAVDPMATFTLTGPGAGVTLLGGQIDAALYGDARLAIRTVTAIGAAIINVTVHTINRAGVDTAQVVAIPAASPVNTRIALPTRGVRVVSIAVTGGTAADQFKTVSEVERAVAL